MSKAKQINLMHFNSIIASIKLRTVDNPITQFSLCNSLKLSGSELRDIVREARKQKIPIGSGNDGYYLCKSKDELISTMNHLKSRSISMLNTIKYMQDIFDETYQIDLFDNVGEKKFV